MKKIRILHAIRQGKVGGGETHVIDLVHSLDKTRFESVILSFTEGPMVDILRNEGFIVHVVNTEKPFDFRIWKSVKNIVESEHINLIHAHGTRANSNSFYAAKSLRIPLIYTVHGWSFHPNQNRIVRYIRISSERLLVNMAQKTICVSESNLQEGKSNFPMARSIVILNGIDQTKFNPDKNYPDVRAEFGIKDHHILIGYIARITAQKEPLNFIRALAQVNVPNTKCLIVGDGELKMEMERLSAQLSLNDKIFFAGFRSDIPAILSAIDVFCLPSLWEGLPIAMLEAMCMRKAIVATSIDGINDLIINGENGLLAQPSNPVELGELLNRVVVDNALRKRIGLSAGKTIRDHFDIFTMTRKIEKEYENCLSSFSNMS